MIHIKVGEVYTIPDPCSPIDELAEVKITKIEGHTDVNGDRYFMASYEYEDGTGEGCCDLRMLETIIEKQVSDAQEALDQSGIADC